MTSTILAKLESTLGTTEFDVVFQSLKSMKATEVAAIASAFVSKTAKSAPKGESLTRIYRRHLNIVQSASKREYFANTPQSM